MQKTKLPKIAAIYNKFWIRLRPITPKRIYANLHRSFPVSVFHERWHNPKGPDWSPGLRGPHLALPESQGWEGPSRCPVLLQSTRSQRRTPRGSQLSISCSTTSNTLTTQSCFSCHETGEQTPSFLRGHESRQNLSKRHWVKATALSLHLYSLNTVLNKIIPRELSWLTEKFSKERAVTASKDQWSMSIRSERKMGMNVSAWAPGNEAGTWRGRMRCQRTDSDTV